MATSMGSSMSKKPKNNSKKPAAKPEEPASEQEPTAQHLHDETRKPLKAPPGGVPPNLPRQFPGKGPGNFGQVQAKGRSFRHQGR